MNIEPYHRRMRKYSESLLPFLLTTVLVIVGAGRILAGKGDFLIRADLTTLYYFLAAASILVLDRLRELAVGDYKITLADVREVAQAEAKAATDMAVLRPHVAPVKNEKTGNEDGSTASAATAHTSRTEAAIWPVKAPGKVPNDPWKDVFGGKCRKGNRELQAKVGTRADNDEWFDLELKIVSLDKGTDPLKGPARIFLHDDFPNNIVEVQLNREGEAILRICAWGAFTVGVQTDYGATELELDLEFLPTLPKKFASR